MALHSVIPPDVLRAYRETHYRAFDQGRELVLHIGHASERLAALHARHGVTCSAFITACNPLGQACATIINQDRQRNLAAALNERHIPLIDGIGEHPSGSWPGEPSFLALGLTLPQAREWGHRYAQNAIVWAAADASPQLILLR